MPNKTESITGVDMTQKILLPQELLEQAVEAIHFLLMDARKVPEYYALETKLRDALAQSVTDRKDSRAWFEQEAIEQGHQDLSRRPDGDYMNIYLNCAWLGWQQHAQSDLEESDRYQALRTQLAEQAELMAQVVEYDEQQRIGGGFNFSTLVDRIRKMIASVKEQQG
jgi:hypothetical protein